MPNIDVKCPYCNCYFSSLQAYSQHIKRYTEAIVISSDESINDNSNIDNILLDNEDFSQISQVSQIEELQTENLQSASYGYEDQDMLSECEGSLENIRDTSNFSENYEISQNYINQPEELNLEYNSEPSNYEEFDEVVEFPNEAYADLMELVIKHNLNNKTSNAIIKFFNKHSNLSTSPLPKNIETGRKLMDLMNIQKLAHSKHRILIHKNKEYFIYYRPIKNCI